MIRQRHVDNDPGVSESSELFALACGPSQTPISVNSCVVNGVSLNDLEIAAFHIDGQSIDVDAPSDIIDVVDEDDDIIDEEDPIPHNLADFDDEDLMLHGVTAMTVAVMIVPLHTRYPPVVRVAWATEANYLGELVRELPLHHPSWRQVAPEQKAGVMAKIGTQFDMRPHMESDRWPQIYAAIQQHLQKIYNGMKDTLKERYWIPDSDGTYDLERIRQTRPSHISEVDWDAQIAFWNDPKNPAQAAQNKKNRAKSKMESSATREYPSLIHTFFLTHTVGDVFLNPEDKAIYDEMLRLQGLGSETSTGVPYTKDEIMAIVRGGKQRGHILSIGRVLPGQGTLFRSDDKFSQMLTHLESQPEIGGGSGSGGCEDDEPGDDEDGGKDGEDEDDS
ncbi:hypothetical protein Tco_1484445 [Tanacetum coccineum]